MLRQSSSRNQKNKVLRVKHVLQISLLVTVCFWLLYQLKHSYDKKKASVDENSEISTDVDEERERFLKLGRKDLPRDEEANPDEETRISIKENENEEVDDEEEKEREAVKQVMEEEGIGEDELARGNEREDEEKENDQEDTDGRGREDGELEYEDEKSEEIEERRESGEENNEEKGDGDNDNDVGSTIDDDTNFGDGDGDSLLNKIILDDNTSMNGVVSNQNESVAGLDKTEGSLADDKIAALDDDTDNTSVSLQNQTLHLESAEDEKHITVKMETDDANVPSLKNSGTTAGQVEFGENSTVSIDMNNVGDANKIVADARVDLSTLPVIQGEAEKVEEAAA